ncbi:hypothetical protein L5515_006442 [Caenorhabditis briggsae]|uniref:BHLH domain-containing protein n=1 Tax=Caenorhabditis briggsae TaxID=6238 RepID=A0AAE9JK11_CAEBR|nr:hypothetical protein L5515_006442 [Caenorhabditis briggsae]
MDSITATMILKQDRKIVQDREKRTNFNEKVAVLRKLIQSDGEEGLSTDTILKKTLDVVKQLNKESTSDAALSGFYHGLYQTNVHVAQFIKNLKLCSKDTEDLVIGVKQLFDMAIHGSVGNHSPRQERVEGKDLKEIKKKREQLRRDRLSAGLNGLHEFIVQNNVAQVQKKKFEKNQILDIIIDYIASTKAAMINRTIQEHMIHAQGVVTGQNKGKELALQFFMINSQLVLHLVQFNAYLDEKLSKIRAPIAPSPAPLNTEFYQLMLQLPGFLNLPAAPLSGAPTSPTGSWTRSSPSSDASSGSTSPAKESRGIVRPWE